MGCLHSRNTGEEKKSFLDKYDLKNMDPPAIVANQILPKMTADDYFASFEYSEEKIEQLNKNLDYIISMKTLQNIDQNIGSLCDINMYEKGDLLDDQALLVISREIAERKSIGTMIIQFSNNRSFSDEGLTSLAVAIRELPRLTSLQLYLAGTNISDLGVQKIMEAIRTTHNLYRMEIGLSDTKIGDQSLFFISLALQTQTNLVDFVLGTQSNPTLTENGFNHLYSGLKTLNECTRINLSLVGEGMKFNDKNFKDLGAAVAVIASLQNVQLSFNECEISDSGLSGFGNNIKKSKALTNLELNLHQTKVTLEAWTKFKKGFIINVTGSVYN